MADEPIDGPFKYGTTPPTELMGWNPELARDADVKDMMAMPPFPPPFLQGAAPATPIWDHIKTLNNGHHWPTVTQLIEDCVAASTCQSGAYLAWSQRRYTARPRPIKVWHIPFVYGCARVFIGNVRNGAPGALGIWGAKAVNQYGVLYDDDKKVPAYHEVHARRWANPPGPGQDFLAIAKARKVQTINQIRTVDQLRDAVSNYHMVTIASMQGFEMTPRNHLGFHIFVPSGSWAHQMAIIAWMDEPFQAGYRLNSWGPDAHGTPLRGEPPGGAWCPASDLENELRQSQIECYSYANFQA